jgi:MoxR-like ATPase
MVERVQEIAQKFLGEAAKVLVDRSRELELTLACLVAGGNLLIEDTPGVGKTTLVKTTAQLLGLAMKRVQFTNDLLPADILGGRIFDPATREFTFHQGPVFAQLVLGDELNRASPRTQSAVLQAMDEHEVTIEGETHRLPEPFFFVGTQNPRDHAGTAPLPESQLDRFLMRIELGAPSRETRRKLLARDPVPAGAGPTAVAAPHELLAWQAQAAVLPVAAPVAEYILDLTAAAEARGWTLSPRATLGLQRAARALAFVRGRPHVRPDDVQEVFPAVVAHRHQQFAAGGAREAAGMARTLLEAVDVP